MSSTSRFLTYDGKTLEVSKSIVTNIYNSRLRAETKVELLKQIALPKNYRHYNEIIGLPTSRITNKPSPITWYQEQYHDDIQKYHHELINKTRKGAFTEGGIRSISLNCFDRYAGHDVIMAAGNAVSIIKEIMIRFDELFKDRRQEDGGKYAFKDLANNKWTHDEIITKFKTGSNLEIEFFNDTRLFGFAVSKQGQRQTFRGPDDTICIFLTEAAHMGMNDDSSVFTALEPNLANRDDGDLIYESTPNGQRGTYHDYCNQWKQKYGLLINQPFPTKINENKAMLAKREEVFKATGWNYREIPYKWAVEAGVVSQKFIEFQKNNPNVDFDQEYDTKFTTSKMAAFDELKPENYLPEGYQRLNLDDILEGKDVKIF